MGAGQAFDKHSGDQKRCELDWPYSKSWHHLRISEIYPAVLHEVMLWMAGNDAVYGAKMVDSSGFSIARYADWYNTKYGKISVNVFAKRHIAQTPAARYAPPWPHPAGPTTRRI